MPKRDAHSSAHCARKPAGAQHEYAAGQSAGPEFCARQHRLHRLAKTHIVCKEHAGAEPLEYSQRWLELKRQEIDSCCSRRSKTGRTAVFRDEGATRSPPFAQLHPSRSATGTRLLHVVEWLDDVTAPWGGSRSLQREHAALLEVVYGPNRPRVLSHTDDVTDSGMKKLHRLNSVIHARTARVFNGGLRFGRLSTMPPHSRPKRGKVDAAVGAVRWSGEMRVTRESVRLFRLAHRRVAFVRV